MTVYKAINAVQKALSKIGVSKNQTNTFDKYKFRGIDDTYNVVGPLLAEHGLIILPRVINHEQVERTSAKGGALFYTTVTVEYDFIAAEDGTKHIVSVIGEAMDRGDKSTNKAMSAAYKHMVFQAFCIPTETQDADAESHEVKTAINVAPRKTQPKQPDLAQARQWLERAATSSMAELQEQWKALDAGVRIALGKEYIDGLKKRAAQSEFYQDNEVTDEPA